MSKGLEAWKETRENYLQLKKEKYSELKKEDLERLLKNCNQRCDIIEKELKRLEKYDKLFEKYGLENTSDFEDYFSLLQVDSATRREDKHKIITLQKALKIIKTMGVFNVYEDIGGKYHLETMVDNVGLTKEEYDLLREVFDND